jgi:hypothetical protein
LISSKSCQNVLLRPCLGTTPSFFLNQMICASVKMQHFSFRVTAKQLWTTEKQPPKRFKSFD